MKPAVVALFVLFAAILIVVLHAKPTKTVGMTAKNVTYIKYTEGEHLAHNKTTDGLYRNQRSLLPGKIESSASDVVGVHFPDKYPKNTFLDATPALNPDESDDNRAITYNKN